MKNLKITDEKLFQDRIEKLEIELNQAKEKLGSFGELEKKFKNKLAEIKQLKVQIKERSTSEKGIMEKIECLEISWEGVLTQKDRELRKEKKRRQKLLSKVDRIDCSKMESVMSELEQILEGSKNC